VSQIGREMKREKWIKGTAKRQMAKEKKNKKPTNNGGTEGAKVVD